MSRDENQLPSAVRKILEHDDTRVIVSAAVVWEIAIKRSLGKLMAPNALAHLLDRSGIQTLPITTHHAELAGALPLIHRDPFDRMLIAQAQTEQLTIVTADERIAQYDVESLWA